MKRTSTLIYVLASLLVIGGILMRLYKLPDERESLAISLLGVLIYILAGPEQPRVSHRNGGIKM